MEKEEQEKKWPCEKDVKILTRMAEELRYRQTWRYRYRHVFIAIIIAISMYGIFFQTAKAQEISLEQSFSAQQLQQLRAEDMKFFEKDFAVANHKKRLQHNQKAQIYGVLTKNGISKSKAEIITDEIFSALQKK